MGKNTEKFDRFVKALDALCREHDVRLTSAEHAHDLLVVYDDISYAPTDAGMDVSRIEDRTENHE